MVNLDQIAFLLHAWCLIMVRGAGSLAARVDAQMREACICNTGTTSGMGPHHAPVDQVSQRAGWQRMTVYHQKHRRIWDANLRPILGYWVVNPLDLTTTDDTMHCGRFQRTPLVSNMAILHLTTNSRVIVRKHVSHPVFRISLMVLCKQATPLVAPYGMRRNWKMCMVFGCEHLGVGSIRQA